MKTTCEFFIILFFSLLLAGCAGSRPEVQITSVASATILPAATLPPSPTAMILPSATSSSSPEPPAAPTPTSPPPGKPVDFRTEDNIKLAGTLYQADGDMAVILAHMGGRSQSAWQDFAAQAAAQGIPALAFDFRCHGKSRCTTSNVYTHLKDMHAAINYLRMLGYRRIVCVGASLGATSCINASLSEDLAGLGVIAAGPATPIEGKVFPADMLNPGIPKLFVVADNDKFQQVRAAMPDLYAHAAQPKEFVHFTGREHGTDLFNTEQAGDFGQAILDFLLQIQAAEASQPVDITLPTALPTLTPLIEMADLANGQGPVYSQSWSPDGKLLAAAGYNEINLWDVQKHSRQVLKGHSSYVWGVDWSPDGVMLASAGQDQGVRLWDTAALTQTAFLPTGWAFSVDWSPDGNRLAVGTYTNGLQLWDPISLEQFATWKSSPSSAIISLAWSPDAQYIAAGALDGAVRIWDAAAGRVVRSMQSYTEARSDVNGLAWSPDGSQLATAHQDGKVRLWDAQAWQMLQVIDAHQGWARGVAWSPDGTLLASSGEDKRMVVWDAATGDWLGEIKHNHLAVWSVVWSPDGQFISSGSGAYESTRAGVAIVWKVVR